MMALIHIIGYTNLCSNPLATININPWCWKSNENFLFMTSLVTIMLFCCRKVYRKIVAISWRLCYHMIGDINLWLNLLVIIYINPWNWKLNGNSISIGYYFATNWLTIIANFVGKSNADFFSVLPCLVSPVSYVAGQPKETQDIRSTSPRIRNYIEFEDL